ncbi:MAG: hypothetical protein FWH56_04170 [Betaproteobacteria bacterium]|nr:hypothetical protein [Betaproteobacteria bacterium]
MSIFSPLPENAAQGDRARRRAMLCLLLALAMTPITFLLFSNREPLWISILPLEGIAYALAAALFGAALAISPVVSVAGWLLALWFGVESVFLPRERRTPTLDAIITGAGLVAWFSPALGVLASIVWFTVKISSLTTGSFDYVHYLQGFGSRLILAGVLVWLPWQYWRGKLRRKSDDT